MLAAIRKHRPNPRITLICRPIIKELLASPLANNTTFFDEAIACHNKGLDRQERPHLKHR
jgi:hypothetical protein